MTEEDGLSLSEQAESKDLVFSAELIDIIEAHLYHVSDTTIDGESVHFSSFPIMYEKDGKLILESAFGGEKEDQIICSECFVEAL